MRPLRFLSIGLTCLLAAISFSHAAVSPVDPQKMYALDEDAVITRQIGYDRIGKWLIRTADPRNQRIQISDRVLDDIIAQSILSGQAITAIAKDLKKGDFALRNELIKIFLNYNFPESQARDMIEEWATSGASPDTRQAIQNVARQPSLIAILREYILNTDNSWPRTLNGFNAVLKGDSLITEDMVKQLVLSNGTMVEKNLNASFSAARQGNVEGKWNIMNGLNPVLGNQGTISRFLKSFDGPRESFYDLIWFGFAQKVATDPLLLNEYSSRIMSMSALYSEVKGVFIKTWKESDPLSDRFVYDFSQGVKIENSRPRWVFNAIKETNAELKEMRPEDIMASEGNQLQAIFRQEVARRCEQNDQWVNYILWQLTRVGEATTLITRYALPGALGNNEAISRALAKESPLLAQEFSELIRKNGAYSFYPQGEKEFRSRISSGTVEKDAILRFGTVVGQSMAYNDDGWFYAMDRKYGETNQKSRYIPQILEAVINADPNTTRMWLAAVQGGDTNLRAAFLKFMIAKGYSQNEDQYLRWADSISQKLKQGNIMGSKEIADFKKFFNEFTKTTEGFEAVELRISVESTGLPYSLRKSMADILVKDPDRFWRLYGMITATPGKTSSGIVPRLKNFAQTSKLSSFLIEEISLQNQVAADAVSTVWDRVLAPDAPIMVAYQTTVEEGGTMSDVYVLASIALTQASRDPEVWQKVRPLALRQMKISTVTNDTELYSHLEEYLSKQGAAAMPLIRQLLKDEVVQKVWKQKILENVKYFGRAYIMADFLMRRPDLQKYWSRGVGEAVIKEPSVAQYAIEALVKRRVGDSDWEKQVKHIRAELADLLIEDRILFEQLITSKNGDFRKSLVKELEQVFNSAVAQEWQKAQL